jgi:hypothetical protein
MPWLRIRARFFGDWEGGSNGGHRCFSLQGGVDSAGLKDGEGLAVLTGGSQLLTITKEELTQLGWRMGRIGSNGGHLCFSLQGGVDSAGLKDGEGLTVTGVTSAY